MKFRHFGTGQRNASSGQVIVFFLMVLVILFFVVLWNFDLHKVIRVRNTTQNAGDAAALIAARWQSTTLNLVGDLNLMQAVALSLGDTTTADAITNIQARLCYTGPMIGFMASQQAAKNNGLFVNDAFTDAIYAHADTVRFDYPAPIGPGGEPLFPEPYPGCWEEYADMLVAVADNGVAVGPDNAKFYTDSSGADHMLLRVDFYEAIAGETWCWFYRNAPTLLDDYENFPPTWWPPLPPISVTEPMNSEIFGLALTKQTSTLDSFVDVDLANDLASARGLGSVTDEAMTNDATWYTYSPGVWTTWDAMSVDGDYPFPSVGPVKRQYDYAGADAATRCQTHANRLSPGPGGAAVSNDIVWTSAAKPFGYLEVDEEIRPNQYGIVLPAFREVRLIPVSASSAPSGGAFNLDWREHIETHLPEYMEYGPGTISGCWYCERLVTWEDPSFRAEGSAWLAAYGPSCDIPSGGGGGGRRSAH